MVTPDQLREWWRLLAEDADELLDPTAAQAIAPKLLAEVERLQALIRQVAVQRDVCLFCGPMDPFGHSRRCPAAPYLDSAPSRMAS